MPQDHFPPIARTALAEELLRAEGAKHVMRRFYGNGVWATCSALDPKVPQFKPGILLAPTVAGELLERLDTAVGLARDHVR
jgi:hypothetical protein